MTRENLKNLGLTDEQIEAVMKQHGQDIKALQEKANAAETTAAEAKEQLKAFEGVNVEELKQTIENLKSQHSAYVFDRNVSDAIHAAGGRSTKAISALLDIEALKGVTENQAEEIAKAVEAVKAENAWAFATAADPAKVAEPETETKIRTGDEHGTGSSGEGISAVEKIFMQNNPGLKID